MHPTMRLGRIAGIEIGFNWSLLVVFWLIAWSLAAIRFPSQVAGYSQTAYWTAAVVTALLFFGSLLLHELAHAVVARRSGVEVEGITLWLFGGVARFRGEAVNAGSEIRVAAVGPAVSVVIGLLFLALSFAPASSAPLSLVAVVVRWLGVINLVLAVFNLIPAFPLDGGRVLRGFLWKRRGDRVSATRTAARAGRIFAYVLVGLGVAEFAFAADLGGLWFVFLGWFLLGAAHAEESQILLREALRDLRVDDVMSRDPVSVRAETTVEELLDDYLMRHRFSTFPVIDETSRPVGLVTLSRIKQVPAAERAGMRIGEVACAVGDVPLLRPDQAVTEVLERMEECSEGRALVVDDDKLVGLVSPRDIQRAITTAGLRSDVQSRDT